MQYVRGMLARQPLLMLLEDLQWADDSSLDLVAHLVSEIPNAALLIVGAARPALFERRPNWGEGQEAYSLLELKALSKRATRSLVEEILQKAAELPEALRELIVEAAEGNPYYVEELIKMLIEDGVIERGESQWQVRVERLAEVRVPPTLTAVLQARLDALPQGEKAVLQRASVVGRQFWDSVVGELAGDAEEVIEVGPLLGALRERELVFQREQSAFADAREYTFKHNILRDVTYETVLRKLRRRYHAQVAGWLEAHAGERLGEYLRVIARHYELAAEALKAAQYLQRAGDEAYKVGSLGDARDCFHHALELLPAGYEAQRATLLVRMGEALDRLGELSAAEERLEQGLSLAERVADRAVEAAALAALGHVAYMRGSCDVGERHARTCLELGRECGDMRGQAQAAVLLSMILIRRGEGDQAERWAEEGLSLYDRIGDRQGVGTALNCLGMMSLVRWDLDRAAQYCHENLALCEEIGDRVGTSRALNDLGEVARKQGDYGQARACYERTLAISSETGNAEMHAIAVINLGMVYLAQVEDGEAWRCLCQGLRESIAMQAKPLALYVLAVMAQLCVRAGEPQRAGELLGVVLHHPSTDSEALEEAQPALEALREAMPPEELEAVLARGAELDLEQVVGEILAGNETSDA
ncbi:MAG: hypothetical protein AMJ93_07990 [Anaerolineae bacterium SM23_84]|nr:MAG: hypothetical protein AMJ93_07990 [Anaerolineae bacterium SM23_84]